MEQFLRGVATIGFSIVVLVDQVLLLSVGTYQVVVALFGILPMRKQNELQHMRGVEPRFLCLTAAHNEEVVLAPHVRNMLSIKYPGDRFRVVVLADNCTDDTASVALQAGADVWVRQDAERRGKGYAIEWALHERADLTEYDAVCIFDADNLVEENFLAVMAAEIRQGKQIIQAHLDTKNPWDSWITASYAISYWFMNRFWQRARMRLGLSGALGGTGFCVTTDVLGSLPWTAHSLTEDLEFTVRALLAGFRVYWTPRTKVYDEKPIAFAATVPQRTRWLQGHWSAAFTFSRDLLRCARSPGPNGRFLPLDMLVYLWQPLVIVATGLNIILTLVGVAIGNRWYLHWLSGAVPSMLWLLVVLAGVALPLVAVNIEDVDWRAVVYLPIFYVFNLSWIPIAVVGYLRRGDMTWHHTTHLRAIKAMNGTVVRGVKP